MGTKKRLTIIVLLMLVVPLLAGMTLYRAMATLHDLEHAQELRAEAVARALVKAVTGLVRYGRDKPERLRNMLAEVVDGGGFVDVTIARDPAEGSFVISTAPSPPAGGALFSEPRYRTSGDTVVFHQHFTLSSHRMGRGCGHGRHGHSAGCTGWGGVEPGRYILRLTLRSEDLGRVRSHIILETGILLVLVLLAAALAAILFGTASRTARLERQVALANQRNETLESLQLIASGIAHETKNPLGSIRGYAQMILERAQDDRTREEAGIMLRELDRVVSKVNEFMTFAGKKEPALADADLAGLALEVQALFAADFTAREMELVCEGCGRPVFARVDAAQIKELCINLVLNALEACAEGDSVTIRVATEAQGSVLEVRDTGPGIPSADLERVLRPYVTTKAGGSGLGLAICKRIAEDHHALLTVQSEEGEGTLVRVRF